MTEPPQLDWNDLADDNAPADPWAEPDGTPRPPVELPTTPTASPAAIAERDRVLRHPDIAKRLCDPPLRYSRPEVWNGYVPPDTWRERHNDSPQRVALLAIITAAVEADTAAQKVTEEASA